MSPGVKTAWPRKSKCCAPNVGNEALLPMVICVKSPERLSKNRTSPPSTLVGGASNACSTPDIHRRLHRIHVVFHHQTGERGRHVSLWRSLDWAAASSANRFSQKAPRRVGVLHRRAGGPVVLRQRTDPRSDDKARMDDLVRQRRPPAVGAKIVARVAPNAERGERSSRSPT